MGLLQGKLCGVYAMQWKFQGTVWLYVGCQLGDSAGPARKQAESCQHCHPPDTDHLFNSQGWPRVSKEHYHRVQPGDAMVSKAQYHRVQPED